MGINTKQDLREALLALPDERDRDFEKGVVSIALSSKVEKFDKWIKDINGNAKLADLTVKEVFSLAETGDESVLDKWLEELMGEPNVAFENAEDEKAGFAAFAAMMEKHRRNQNFTEEDKLLDKYTLKFKKDVNDERHPFFNHLKFLCLQTSKIRPSDQKMLEIAANNCGLMPNHSGVVHSLAITVADVFEKPVSDDLVNQGWLEKGLDAIARAISLDSRYAKFYCTRARLLAIKGQYEQALNDISVAIDFEDDSKEDYALRIDYYRSVRQQIVAKRESEEMVNNLKCEVEKVHQELKEESHNNLVKNMEFLGLFAGLVSFTIGGITIATAGFKAIHAAAIILVLLGALLGVFAGFGVILHGNKGEKKWRNIIVGAIASVIIVIGVIILCCVK